jgi:hypothetical protein
MKWILLILLLASCKAPKKQLNMFNAPTYFGNDSIPSFLPGTKQSKPIIIIVDSTFNIQ